MRRPPKSIQPILDIASLPGTTIDEFMSALSKVDKELIKNHAFHVLQAIPESDNPAATIKFAAVHHVIGSDSSVLASIADSCIRGPMPDKDACIVMGYLLERDWIPKVPGLLINACAYGKPECATLFNTFGLYKKPSNWDYWLSSLDESQAHQMVKLLIEIVNPDRQELLSLRLAAKPNSPISDLVDRHLNLKAVLIDSISTLKN